jgi:hypothetical protein
VLFGDIPTVISVLRNDSQFHEVKSMSENLQSFNIKAVFLGAVPLEGDGFVSIRRTTSRFLLWMLIFPSQVSTHCRLGREPGDPNPEGLTLSSREGFGCPGNH